MDDVTGQYYWALTEYDGTLTKIPPDSVEVVKRRWGNGDPIHTTVRSIPANQIRSFRITSEKYSDTPLIEAAAQAFKEPIYTKVTGPGKVEEDAIACRWIKLVVPMDSWGKYYAAIPSYKFLGELNGMAEVALLRPIHLIDPNRTPYCTEEEVKKLTKSRYGV